MIDIINRQSYAPRTMDDRIRDVQVCLGPEVISVYIIIGDFSSGLKLATMVNKPLVQVLSQHHIVFGLCRGIEVSVRMKRASDDLQG